MNKSITSFFLVLFLMTASLYSSSTLTFEERVKAQEAIERVYYENRIWPTENPTPKPPFEELVPGDVIKAKVIDYLKKSERVFLPPGEVLC